MSSTKPTERSALPRVRLVAMLVGFVGLTSLGVWWAAPSGDVFARTGRELASLGVANLVMLVAIAAAVIGGEMVRLVVVGRVLGVRVGVRAAFDASVANDLFSWISPVGVLGEPAAVYVMARRGVPLDAALAISFGKFATSFTFIMGLACVLFALGYGPEVPRWAVVSIVVTVGLGALLIGSFVIGAWWPAPSLRMISAIEAWALRRRLLSGPLASRAIAASAGVAASSIERLAQFRRAGTAGWLAIFGCHVLYYASYVGLLVALAWMFDARSIAAIIPIAIVYQAFTYIAPAPGIPEAGAATFFGLLLPDGDAFVVVLLFRALTAYLQVILGLVYLPIVGMLRAILTR